MMRSRGIWLEYGEKNAKYFLSQEKRNHTRKHIRKLCLSGVITTNYEKIIDSSSKYYKKTCIVGKLIRCSPIFWNILGQARITNLSEEDRLKCEGLITIEECVEALDTFEKGKTPYFFLPSLLKVINSFILTKENIHHSLVAYMKMGTTETKLI